MENEELIVTPKEASAILEKIEDGTATIIEKIKFVAQAKRIADAYERAFEEVTSRPFSEVLSETGGVTSFVPTAPKSETVTLTAKSSEHFDYSDYESEFNANPSAIPDGLKITKLASSAKLKKAWISGIIPHEKCRIISIEKCDLITPSSRGKKGGRK